MQLWFTKSQRIQWILDMHFISYETITRKWVDLKFHEINCWLYSQQLNNWFNQASCTNKKRTAHFSRRGGPSVVKDTDVIGSGCCPSFHWANKQLWWMWMPLLPKALITASATVGSSKQEPGLSVGGWTRWILEPHTPMPIRASTQLYTSMLLPYTTVSPRG